MRSSNSHSVTQQLSPTRAFDFSVAHRTNVKLNNKIMISGKGILYTVLGAAGAAVLAGTMLTGGHRGEKMRKIGSGLQNLLAAGRKRLTGSSQESQNRAEYNQAHDRGHA
jgi:outer membrane murein-binding lipoprotein Lpp